jgi:hypothetical protein
MAHAYKSVCSQEKPILIHHSVEQITWKKTPLKKKKKKRSLHVFVNEGLFTIENGGLPLPLFPRVYAPTFAKHHHMHLEFSSSQLH